VIKSIVLAIDGSIHAKHAQIVAIDLASKYDAQLTLVHVLTRDHPSNEFARMAEVEHLPDSGQPRVSEKENIYSAVARFLGSANDSKEARVMVLLGEQIINNASASAQAPAKPVWQMLPSKFIPEIMQTIFLKSPKKWTPT